jgi:hypothetical protein
MGGYAGMNNEMTLKDLEKYCTKEAIKNVALAADHDADRYHKGLAVAFMWIAACIQNGELPEDDDKEVAYVPS